ncbi:flagellar hook-length control protein FliK [Fictibacillus iocasae]|uniref:Flagellar hook-length control protein FliK n=1 Tax=Fictibacillus iocasae TaxID=2715437 RepID=A0ABW2NNG4_9BACL
MATVSLQHDTCLTPLSKDNTAKTQNKSVTDFFSLLLQSNSAAVTDVHALEEKLLPIDVDALAAEIKEMLPEDVSLWQSGMLDDPSAEEIMDMLPPDVKEELEFFVQSLQTLELTEKALSDSAAPAAILMALLHHASKGSLMLSEGSSRQALIEFIKQQLKGNGTETGNKAQTYSLAFEADKVKGNSRLLRIEHNESSGFVFKKGITQEQAAVTSSTHALQAKAHLLSALTRQVQPASSSPSTEVHVFHQGTMTAAEQLAIQLPAGNKLSESRFLREFQSILQKGKLAALAGGSSSITLKLNPENLGSISIEIVQKNGELTAKITAASIAAKEAIDQHMGTLKNALTSQKIALEQIDVFVQEKMSLYKDQGGNREPRQEADQQQSFDDEKNDPDSRNFSDILQLLSERV